MPNKKAAIIIAFKDFQDEEYLVTRNALEGAGIKVSTASSQKGIAVGKFGGEIKIDTVVSGINIIDFDAVIFIGGPGAVKYFDDKEWHKIVKEAVENKKVLAAICIAPVILARAGVLRGKKATVWASNMDKSGVKILEKEGAKYFGNPVEIDGNIITGNGPESAGRFVQEILTLL
ncbi:MAG: DJ-1/PfpI family protein [Candidatus Nealsonbacteria bacterium]|nr:DJ-1/PfpI family protein [Candidatus Nealsonbacteria bacterium]